MPRYTVRPLGACAWASGVETVREARHLAEEARDVGLRDVVIIDELTHEIVEEEDDA